MTMNPGYPPLRYAFPESEGSNSGRSMLGVGPYSASNFFRNATAADANPFDSTPFTMGVLFHTQQLVNGDNGIIVGRHSVGNASGAYFFQDVGTPNVVEFAIFNGAAGVIVSPTIQVAPNHTYIVGMSYDGTTVRLFQKAGESGSGTATTGYTANATIGISVGNPNFTTKVLVSGFCIGSTILNAAQWTQWCSDVKKALDIVALPAGNVLNYSVKQSMPDRVTDNPWVPVVGSLNTLELNGTVPVVQFTPSWGNA